jgi:hypothetical protein
MPIFLPIAPDRNPRTEWGCQLVALMSSFSVAPSGRRSSPRTLAVLLPSRAPDDFRPLATLGALARLLTLVALFADFGFDGATRGFRGAALAFVVAFGSLARAVAWADS